MRSVSNSYALSPNTVAAVPERTLGGTTVIPSFVATSVGRSETLSVMILTVITLLYRNYIVVVWLPAVDYLNLEVGVLFADS